MNRYFLLKPFRILPFTKSLKINAQISLYVDKIHVEFALLGDLKEILIPPPATAPARLYDLWEHTCFELFLKKKNSSSYIEFNFSPSGDWNCFFISSYRVNEGEFEKVNDQKIDVLISNDRFVLKSDIQLNFLPDFTIEDFKFKNIEIGLSSVLERKDKALIYYALVHRGQKPDFHNSFMDF